MAKALIALHYQNDICHPQGRIPFAIDRAGPDAAAFLEASLKALHAARAEDATIVHVRIAFAEDYSDLPRNCRLFRAVEELGAVKRDSWGAAPLAGFAPRADEIALIHNCNSAFRGTNLEEMLRARRIDRLSVMGLATQFSVEHTVRDAADMGFQVTLLRRCCASADLEAHLASLRTMAMLAEVQ